MLDVSLQFDSGEKNQTRVAVVNVANNNYVQFHFWQNNRVDVFNREMTRIRNRTSKQTS